MTEYEIKLPAIFYQTTNGRELVREWLKALRGPWSQNNGYGYRHMRVLLACGPATMPPDLRAKGTLGSTVYALG